VIARLQAGDRVAVVAPAGPVPRERFEAGERILSARYHLVYEERVFARTGYLAGSDEERLAELNAALRDPTAKAVICARGGYGLMRILGELDAAAFARAPKAIVGFSDVTALHAWAAKAGVPTIHGPVLGQLGDLPAGDTQSIIDLLEGAPVRPLDGLLPWVGSGIAEGRLLGGNLEIVSRLVGTPWAFDLRDAILLLEEVGERPYRIDRALTQLLLSGALAGVRGVVVGDLINCHEPKPPSSTAQEVLVERLGRLGIPVWGGAPIGHGGRNRAVPLGVRARLSAGTLEFLEPFAQWTVGSSSPESSITP
jgi:muramoyltetrapeptide carboxypeptidase